MNRIRNRLSFQAALLKSSFVGFITSIQSTGDQLGWGVLNTALILLGQAGHSTQHEPKSNMNCMDVNTEAAVMARSFEQTKEVRTGMHPQGVHLEARNRSPGDAEPQEENKGLTDTNNGDHQGTSEPRNLQTADQSRKRVRREEKSNPLGGGFLEQRTENGGHTERAAYQQPTAISLLYSKKAPPQETIRSGQCIAETWSTSISSLQQGQKDF